MQGPPGVEAEVATGPRSLLPGLGKMWLGRTGVPPASDGPGTRGCEKRGDYKGSRVPAAEPWAGSGIVARSEAAARLRKGRKSHGTISRHPAEVGGS